MSELARSAGLLGTQRIVLVVLGAVRTKIAAYLLGPAGLGILAQASALRELLAVVCQLGSRSGYVDMVSDAHERGDGAALRDAMLAVLSIVGMMSTMVGFVVVLQAPRVAQWAFADPGRTGLVLLALVTVVLAVPRRALSNTFLGVLDYRSLLWIGVAESIVAIVAMALLARWFGVAGAVASFLCIEVVALGAAWWLLRRRVLRPMGISLRGPRPRRQAVVGLLRLAGALSATALVSAGAVFFVRGEILDRLGAEANGFYQVAWQVGQNYLGMVGVVLWGYGLPKVTRTRATPGEVLRLQNELFRLIVALLPPGVIVLLVLREFWIPLLFSEAFLPAASLLVLQLSGELVSMLRQSMNISLLPHRRLGFMVLQPTLFWGLWALGAMLGLSSFGLVAVAGAYLASNLVMWVVSWGYHRRVFGYRLDSDNRRSLAWAAPLFLLAAALSQQSDPVLGTVLPLSLATLALLARARFLRGLVA